MEHNGKERKGGRQPIPYPGNWIDVYNEWCKGNLSTREASYELNIGYGTFYNMAERYEIANGIIRERDKTARKSKSKGLSRVAMIKGRFAYQACKYNDYIERNILPRIDYQKLHDSYYADDMEYAKGIFNLLHQAMVKIYGTDIITASAEPYKSSAELILIPGVVAGPGEICIGLLVTDLTGTVRKVDFLTEYGCCSEDINEDMLPEEKSKLKEVAQRYTPYVCGYAVDLPEDNFNMNELPYKVKEFFTNFKDYKVRLLCGSSDYLSFEYS